MKYLAKLVTGILLIALSCVPAFAAIPCQQNVRSMPCCDRTMCPLMAKMSSHREIGHRGMKNTSEPCCKTHSGSFVAVTDHKSTEIPVTIASAVTRTAISPAAIVASRPECVIAVNLRDSQHAQAFLSTFLI